MKHIQKASIPVQPDIEEVSPGVLQIDTNDMARFQQESINFKQVWDQNMQGAEDDPDEIMRRMMEMFK